MPSCKYSKYSVSHYVFFFCIINEKKLILTLHAREIFCLCLHFERWFKPFPQEETPYKSEMTKCIFGDQVRKISPTVHRCILFWYSCEISFCRDLWTEYIVTTAFQSYPTTKKCASLLLLCGSPMLTKKENND